MIEIHGFLHRDALKELIGRWMLDRSRPSDGLALTRLVLFNGVVVTRYLERLAEDLLGALYDCKPQCVHVDSKGALKDRIADLAPQPSPRTAALIAAYRYAPGLYYRETPYNGRMYLGEIDGRPAYLGGCRIKRSRRLAEKGARRIVDGISVRPGATAFRSASSPLISESPTDLAARLRAEAVFMDRLRSGQTPSLQGPLAINDVAGIKVVLPRADTASLRAGSAPEERLMRILSDLACATLEREVHDGAYRAVNLVVEHTLNKSQMLAQPLPQTILGQFAAHGVDAETAQRDFRAFVQNGEASVRIELIASGYEDMLESEIGRCMHEERIIRQRRTHRYQGQLGENLAVLLEDLLSLPTAPVARVTAVPVRLWNRYLPDYFDDVRRRLFHIPSAEIADL